MTNLEKYCEAYISVFNVSADQLNESFTVNDCAEWDSMTHLELMTALEDAFDIMMEPEDIIALDSFEKGKKLMANYGIEI